MWEENADIHRPTPVNILGEIREYLRQKTVEPGDNSNGNVGFVYFLK